MVLIKQTNKKLKEILIDKKSFTAEDIRTSIVLLSTNDYDVCLRAIGNLCRNATKDGGLLEQYVTYGIYPNLLKLLENNDVTVLKYTSKLLAMLASHKSLPAIDFATIVACGEMMTRHYIETNDDFMKECSSFVLWQYVQYSEVITNEIYSDQLIKGIFDAFKETKDLDILWNSLNLLHYLLDVEIAKEDIVRNNVFSARVLVCLLECQQEGVKELTIDVLHKLSKWRTRNITMLLVGDNVLNTMVKLVMQEDARFLEKTFEIIQNCVSNEEGALEFSKSTEFAEFIRWLQRGSNVSLLQSLPILSILTKTSELRQKLYDLNFDEMALNWLRYRHEGVVYYLLQIIDNLSQHKRCCETFSKFIVVKTVKNVILEGGPQKELALETLRNLLVRSPKTLDYFVGCDGASLIQRLLSQDLSIRHQKIVIELVQLLVTSKHAPQILNDVVFEHLLSLYKESDLKYRILTLINSLSKYEDYRRHLVEIGGVDALLEGLKSERTSFGTKLHLEIISNLIKYEEIASKFLDLDLLPLLKSVRGKMKLAIVEDTIKDLYNYCLTTKFYETGRLETYNQIDDKFYLIRDDLSEEQIKSLVFTATTKPIYVVSLTLVRIAREPEANLPRATSGLHVEADENDLPIKRRVLSTLSALSQTSMKVKVTYEHRKIPENILAQRSKTSVVKDLNFYQDYYLERYILILLRDLYFSDGAPETMKERVEYIAKYVDRQLSGILVNLTESEKKEVFKKHLLSLKNSTGMNVVPLGYLRMGYCCERALLFKVLCDNLCVPTTLCRNKNQVYWNEVSFGIKEPVYVVDLINKVGNLMQLNTLEADEYLNVFL